MTWGELKRQVEKLGAFNDNTKIYIYNEEGLFCETTDNLIDTIKDRIVLAERIYPSLSKDKLEKIVNKTIK